MGQGSRRGRVAQWLGVALWVVYGVNLQGCSGKSLCEMTARYWCCTDIYGDQGKIGENCDCRRDGCSRAKASVGVAARGEALYLGASAHLAGALGTNWRSDVEIHSVGNETATFTIAKLDHGSDNSSPASVQLTLEPGRSVRLGDVLDSQFAFEGKAALMVVPAAGRVVVTSRTYNLLGDGNPLGLPAGATFGQFIAALPVDEAIRFGEQGRLIQLEHSNDPNRGFRTNLGLVNATLEPTVVEVELYTAAGALLGTVPLTLAALEYRQIDRVFTRVTGNDVADGYAVVRTTSADGRFFAFASVVDNLTGDPVAIPAIRLPNPTGPQIVVAAAHTAGIAGTNWRTDVEVHCWSGPATYAVELLEHGMDNSSPQRRELTIEAGTCVRHDDILSTLFGFDGAAALRITPVNGEVLVTSRTYNLLGEGNPLGLSAGATFGQFIPSVTSAQAIQWAEQGRLIQLAHDPSGAGGFRTNLILVNSGAGRITVTIDLYTADGVHLGAVSQELAPSEYRQLNRVFESVTANVVEDGYAVVQTTTEGGAVFALASVVDNLTGDPVGMGAPIIRQMTTDTVIGYVDDVTALFNQGFSFEDMVDVAQTVGVDGMLDAVVAGTPGTASRTGSELLLDYGGGYEPGGGGVLSGQERWDLSGLSIGADAITGRVVLDTSAMLVDGEPPIVPVTTVNFDIQERSEGSVVGNIDLVGVGSSVTSDVIMAGAIDLVAAGSSVQGDVILTGFLDIDTAICLDYPIGGEVVLRHDDQLTTITFGPNCDGVVTRTIEPSADDESYPSAVLADAPVGYWRFEEDAGAAAVRDSSRVGGTQDGVVRSGVSLGQTSANDNLGRAAAFSGSATSFIDLGNPSALRSTGDVSMEWWQRPARLDGPRVVFGNGAFQAPESPGDNIQYQGGMVDGAFEAFHEGGNGVNSSVRFSASATTDEWTYVVIVRASAAQTYSLYLNGQLQATASYDEAPSGDGSHERFATLIGGQFANVDLQNLKTRFAFNGSLDEVAFYDRQLSAGRILAHYTAATNPGD